MTEWRKENRLWYVYVLQSVSCTGKFYTGFTDDLKRRLKEHNADGNKGHTAKHQPWKLHACIGFSDKKTALKFEKYLKMQAGGRFQKLKLQKN